ncbi:MAG: hypothetical protein ACTS2F_07145 [Thainema sp.]
MTASLQDGRAATSLSPVEASNFGSIAPACVPACELALSDALSDVLSDWVVDGVLDGCEDAGDALASSATATSAAELDAGAASVAIAVGPGLSNEEGACLLKDKYPTETAIPAIATPSKIG